MIVDIVNYNRHCQWATTQYTLRTQELSSIFETTLTKLSFIQDNLVSRGRQTLPKSHTSTLYTLAFRRIELLVILVLLVVLFSLVLVLDIRLTTMLLVFEGGDTFFRE